MKPNLPNETHIFVTHVLQTAAATVGYALTVRLFLLPADLITGGATGISLFLHHLAGLSLSPVLLALNILFLLWGLLELGKAFAAATVISSLLYPVALMIFERLITSVPTEDPLLCTLFSGLGMGVFLGIMIRAGSSSGGTDIPVLILNKRFGIPVSAGLYASDCLILLLQSLYAPADRILYGILLILIYSIVLDHVLLSGSSRSQIMVVSRHQKEIRELILHHFDRGVTIFHGEGGYSGEDCRILLSIISNRELPRLEHLIREADPECFLTVTRVREVCGRGLTLQKMYL